MPDSSSTLMRIRYDRKFCSCGPGMSRIDKSTRDMTRAAPRAALASLLLCAALCAQAAGGAAGAAAATGGVEGGTLDATAARRVRPPHLF